VHEIDAPRPSTHLLEKPHRIASHPEASLHAVNVWGGIASERAHSASGEAREFAR